MHLFSILPSYLAICWLRTSWPPLPYSFTSLGLLLEKPLGNCVSPCPCFPFETACTGILVAGRQRGRRALTDVVEASRRQALWQVCGVEERGQEGHGRVLLVVQGGFILRTIPRKQEQLQGFRGTSGLERRPPSFSSPEAISAHACGHHGPRPSPPWSVARKGNSQGPWEQNSYSFSFFNIKKKFF